MVDDLRAVIRLSVGRNAEPTATVIDSRTLRSRPESGKPVGYDGNKRKKRPIIHMAIDALGPLLALRVTSTSAEVERLARAMQAVTDDIVEDA